MNRSILYIWFFLFPVGGMAEQIVSIGDAARELMEPVTVLSSFIASGSIIVGVLALVGALMRYLQYRTNPLASPLSMVIVLLILGLLLIGLPFTYLLTGAGIPFSFYMLPKDLIDHFSHF